MKIKIKLMYSYIGIAAAGSVLFLLLQILFFIFKRTLLSPSDIVQTFLYISVIFTFLIFVTNISLIKHEKFRLRNLIGTALGAAWTAGNFMCLAAEQYFTDMNLLGDFILLFGCYADLTISGIFLSAYIAAKHKPEYDKDFVIILGCSISKNGGLLPLLKGRTNRAIRFAWDQERASGKPARFIPTGGQGDDEVISEGSAMELYLLSHGAEQYEIFPEKKSANTYENMLFSKRITDNEKPDAKICFVTTNYHVLRSGLIARKVGLDAEGLASDTKWYFWPNGLAREVFAVILMYPVLHLAAAAICLIAAVISCYG